MSKHIQKIVIAFDVNGTLTLPRIRKLFQAIDRDAFHIVVWSTLGAKYSQQFCKKHNLHADEFLDKRTRSVDIAIDDNPHTVKNNASVILRVDKIL